MATRLVQLHHPGFGRRVALVDGEELQLLGTYRSVYQFVQTTLETGYQLRDLLSTDLTGVALDYAQVWALETEWRFLPSFDQPDEPGRCLVSGSPMTHPSEAGSGGARLYPEWYYKGNGTALRGHGDPLAVPEFAIAASERAGIAAVYVIDGAAVPRRVGLSQGNELCDGGQATGDTSAGSKLLPGSVGPELWVDAKFDEIPGSVRIQRAGQPIWSAELFTGEGHALHRLKQIEIGLFRHAGHRRPGDVHVHFWGFPASSYLQGVRLQDGDEMTVSWQGFGRPLMNRVQRMARLLPEAAVPL